MKEIDLGDDDGYVTVKFGGHEVRLDLYQAYNRLLDLDDAVEPDEEGRKPRGVWLERVATWLRELGFEGVSHRLADRFAETIFGRVKELKNAAGGSGRQDSPASTAPQS